MKYWMHYCQWHFQTNSLIVSEMNLPLDSMHVGRVQSSCVEISVTLSEISSHFPNLITTGRDRNTSWCETCNKASVSFKVLIGWLNTIWSSLLPHLSCAEQTSSDNFYNVRTNNHAETGQVCGGEEVCGVWISLSVSLFSFFTLLSSLSMWSADNTVNAFVSLLEQLLCLCPRRL